MTDYVYFDLHENFVCLLKLLTTSYLIKSKFEKNIVHFVYVAQVDF